jgi:adenylosuccinate lyase
MVVTNNNVSLQGKPNDLVARMKSKDFFKPIWGELDNMLKAEL